MRQAGVQREERSVAMDRCGMEAGHHRHHPPRRRHDRGKGGVTGDKDQRGALGPGDWVKWVCGDGDVGEEGLHMNVTTRDRDTDWQVTATTGRARRGSAPCAHSDAAVPASSRRLQR